MLDPKNTILVIIDVQHKLAAAMHDKGLLVENLVKLVKGAQVLQVPVIVTEQNPRGLGETLPEIGSLLGDFEPVSKLAFSCCRENAFAERLEKSGRGQVLVAGIEAHVCVYQTALGLKAAGYETQVVSDCISSRTAENKAIALERLRYEGVALTGVETVLFELLGTAEGNRFRQILGIVK